MTTTLISGVCAIVAATVAVGLPSILSSDAEAVDCKAYVLEITRMVREDPTAADMLAYDLDDGAMHRETDACMPPRQAVFQARNRLGDPCSAKVTAPVPAAHA